MQKDFSFEKKNGRSRSFRKKRIMKSKKTLKIKKSNIQKLMTSNKKKKKTNEASS